MRQIQIVNQSTVVDPTKFQQTVLACSLQVSGDFAPSWGGATAFLQGVSHPPGTPYQPQHETIYVVDDADQADALGYHELTATDKPIGFVFARTALTDRTPWSLTLSHELLEQIVDPYVCTCAVVPGIQGNARVMAVEYEICDPVEQDAYVRAGVEVSNFVLPAWFQPVTGAVGPYDFLKKLTAPLSATAGGYIGFTSDLRTWQQQVYNRTKPLVNKYDRHRKRKYTTHHDTKS